MRDGIDGRFPYRLVQTGFCNPADAFPACNTDPFFFRQPDFRTDQCTVCTVDIIPGIFSDTAGRKVFPCPLFQKGDTDTNPLRCDQ